MEMISVRSKPNKHGQISAVKSNT